MTKIANIGAMALAVPSDWCEQVATAAKKWGLDLHPDQASEIVHAAMVFVAQTADHQSAPAIGEVAKKLQRWRKLAARLRAGLQGEVAQNPRDRQKLAARLQVELQDAWPLEGIDFDDPVSHFVDLRIFATAAAVAGGFFERAHSGGLANKPIGDVIRELAAFEEAAAAAEKSLPTAKRATDRGPYFADFVRTVRRTYEAAGGTGKGVHWNRGNEQCHGLYSGKLFHLIDATLEIVGDPFSRNNGALGKAIERALHR